MDSMTAARIGYNAMMRGRRVVVTGFSNKLSVLVCVLYPDGPHGHRQKAE